MKLMTKEIERKLAKYPLYSQDGRGGEFFVPDDWQGYVPTEPEGIENCRWLHNGKPCIILNGLPRIFP